MAGEWDAPDLVAALTVLAGHAAELIPAPLQRLRTLWAPRHPHTERNTPDGSRANISRHYDLSNDLFALFLDDTLTYSSAVFRGFPASHDLLAAAQHRKIDRLLDLADVGEGTRLLEIGTGWGELALRAAARGARVTSLTLSREQRPGRGTGAGGGSRRAGLHRTVRLPRGVGDVRRGRQRRDDRGGRRRVLAGVLRRP